MTVALEWLAERDLQVDFLAYPEKPKSDFLLGLHKMYARNEAFHPLLEKVLNKEDF
jgi:hypothetical protein